MGTPYSNLHLLLFLAESPSKQAGLTLKSSEDISEKLMRSDMNIQSRIGNVYGGFAPIWRIVEIASFPEIRSVSVFT